ncbi:MAG: potassium-transporting ATPase subunit B, partial [Acidobacteriaceae bacterium]|nr:potassium-transporting ATPase subunit B [Acidobacteriaceae bacterium]
MFARAIRNAFDELNFRSARRKPTLAVIELAGIAVAIALIKDLLEPHRNWAFDLEVVIAIWATALATTLAPAWAKALGKAHADTLRREKGELFAKRLDTKGKLEIVSASRLCIGDTVLIEAGDLIPGDGDIVEGIASVDESAITGESAPVIRESGGARSAVSAGARVLSDHIKVRITSNPAETLLDRMAAMVEGEDRDLTPDEISAAHMVAALTLGALLSTLMLAPLAMYAVLATGDLSVITVLAS